MSDELLKHSHRYEAAARLGDVAGVRRTVDAALGTGAAVRDVHAFVIAPAMVEIGALWERGSLGVADEHLATAITVKEIERLYRLHPDGELFREDVVLAAVEGEQHVLGLRMSADLLEVAGFRTRYLGGDLPVASLLEFIEKQSPAVVVLSVKQPELGEALRSELESLRHSSSAPPRIVVAGDGVPEALRDGEDPLYVAGVDQIVAAVESLV
jgi:methanogenic corrinoid protein MtbC1